MDSVSIILAFGKQVTKDILTFMAIDDLNNDQIDDADYDYVNELINKHIDLSIN